VPFANGSSDDAPALNDIFTAVNAGDTLYFPSGIYKIDTALNWEQKNINITGDGSRKSIIRAGANLATLLKLGNNSNPTSMMSDVTIEKIGFQGGTTGRNFTAHGLQLANMNFMTLTDVEFRFITGTALKLLHIEDAVFTQVLLTNCGNGNLFSGDPVLQISDATFNSNAVASNSLTFLGCQVERTYGTGFLISKARAIKIIGCKFHGNASFITNFTRNHLVVFEQTDQMILMGNQFVYGNNYGVYITGTGATPKAPSIIQGNMFNSPSNHATMGTTPVWNIVIEAGSHIIDGNMFMVAGTSANQSYVDDGGDIWLKNGVLSAYGNNYHLQTLTNAGNYIKADGTPASKPTKIL
jgi:Right handed beta helix region